MPFDYLKLTEKLLLPLAGKLAKRWDAEKKKAAEKATQREEALDRINDVFTDPLALARLYIEPDLQQFNPANDPDEDLVRQPALHALDTWFKGDRADKQRFILADAGMGKTSILVMLRVAHLMGCWPDDVDVRLLKLGHDTLDTIAAMTGRRRTVLLLDSLDEDPTAWGRVESRLTELLDATQNFRRVLLTCRTQFFSGGDDPFDRRGRVLVGGHQVSVRYLALFSDTQVDAYLSRRFPRRFRDYLFFRPNPQAERARPTLAKMRDLRFRPMLLAHVDAIVEHTGEWTTYGVLDAMVETWLTREQRKARQRGESVTWEQLRDGCVAIARHLHANELQELSEDELAVVVHSEAALEGLRHMDVGGRSLLNRRSDGAFRFAHRLVQEYLLVYWARSLPADTEERLIPSDAMQVMASELIRDGVLIPAIGLDEFGAFEDVFIAGIPVRFRLIPAGEFLMGSPATDSESDYDERPQRAVTLTQPFWLMDAPLTQAVWQAVMGENPAQFKGANRPVESVSWDDVERLIERLAAQAGVRLRLPTEAQWEYACRAGTTAPRYGELGVIAWFDQNSDGQTHPVKQKQPNPWGLYDMLGNVAEWCKDRHGAYPQGPTTDPTGPADGANRVLRGGSWITDARSARAASRFWDHPGLLRHYLGVRLARGPAPSAGCATPAERARPGPEPAE